MHSFIRLTQCNNARTTLSVAVRDQVDGLANLVMIEAEAVLNMAFCMGGWAELQRLMQAKEDQLWLHEYSRNVSNQLVAVNPFCCYYQRGRHTKSAVDRTPP
jgi:hypothetical protein